MQKICLCFLGVILLISCSIRQSNIPSNSEISLMTQNTASNYSELFFAQIPLKNFKEELQQEAVILLDIRSPQELQRFGYISDNQIHIDFYEPKFAEQIRQLDKSKKYLIYCWHGSRSAVARDFMKGEGFSYVKDLEGGIDAWIDAGEDVIIK